MMYHKFMFMKVLKVSWENHFWFVAMIFIIFFFVVKNKSLVIINNNFAFL